MSNINARRSIALLLINIGIVDLELHSLEYSLLHNVAVTHQLLKGFLLSFYSLKIAYKTSSVIVIKGMSNLFFHVIIQILLCCFCFSVLY